MTESALGVALVFWKRNQPIPMHIWSDLVEAGYDVACLERFHRGRAHHNQPIAEPEDSDAEGFSRLYSPE